MDEPYSKDIRLLKKPSWRRIKAVLAPKTKTNRGVPVVFARRHHKLSEDDISSNARKVLHRLQSLGHAAYLVGGGVRDLLLHRTPKDFDVVTDASPEVVRQIFRNSRLIGRRFRLVHVYFRQEIIEVSTFRANVEESFKDQSLRDTKGKRPGMLLQDNTYGTIEEDAWRRDITINALYYNIADHTVVDYTGGMKDLQKKMVRIIGDPAQRFHEDPVRLLRVVRLAAKLGCKIHADTKTPLLALQGLLQHVPSSRLFDETLKLFFEGNAAVTYPLLTEMGYMQAIFPGTMKAIEKPAAAQQKRLVGLAMGATDERFAHQQSLNPGFLLSVLLWPVVQALLNQKHKKQGRLFPALYYGINVALERQGETLVIPRRLTAMMRSVWTLQYHLERRRGKRVFRVYHQRYFRAAFDFLALRAQAGEPVQALVDWWQAFQDNDKNERQRMLDDLR